MSEEPMEEGQEAEGDSGISIGGQNGGNTGGRKKSSLRKGLGTLKDNIVGAMRGDARHIFILKAKLIAIVVIVVLVLAAMFVQGIVEVTSRVATESVTTTFKNSTTPAAVEFNKSGSLILASEDELQEINDNFMKSIENKTEAYYNSFTTKYSGKQSASVANKVTHITTNYEANETAEVSKISNQAANVSGAASLADERTIFEHILRAEKYNFNNIIWRSFVKSSSGLKQENMSFRVDSSSKLKYPASDSGDIDNAAHDLDFFLTKTRAYLQSWYIPFDIAIGMEGISSAETNTKFAYEIMASAYHEIVLDRYKVETLTRTTNYLVYDQKATAYQTIRRCANYTVQTAEGKRIVTYCVDRVEEKKVANETKKDVRESIGVNDETTYRWDYVVSQAKLFDNVISNEYKFEALYNYPTTNYNSYINKTGKYASMKIEEFEAAEETNSKSDGYSHTSEPYNDVKTVETYKIAEPWNDELVVNKIPEGANEIANSVQEKILRTQTKYEKTGNKYEDIYVWNDNLNFESTKSGIYNVDSVKDVTGDDLSSSDQSYYQDLYSSQEINLIDLMNSDKNIYSNYMSITSMSSETENIGIRKGTLQLAYSALKSDLTKNIEKYNFNSIRYGSSLGIDTTSFTTLSGLSFSGMENIAAGNLEGMNVAYPIATEELKNAYLQVEKKYGNSYGYRGHGGVDISYAYSAADNSLCKDYSGSTCPFIRGPAIYAAMDGVITGVTYCPYNKYYNVGQNVGKYDDGKLKVNSTTGWGSYVKIENVDGSGAIYSHLFPDRDFLKQMSESIGQTISAGTFIGYMGNTGNSTGLHLHIEFGQSVNTLGGGRTSNSSLTYVYLKKIIDTMGISPRTI